MANNKFGISVGDGVAGILQPKLKYKYRVLFHNYGGVNSREYTRNIVSVDRPKLQYEEVPIHSYNSVAYAMGKHLWSPINCSLRDTVDNSVSKLTGRQVQRQVDHHNQTSALSGADYKFNMDIDILTGGSEANDYLERWKIEGCFVQNVDYDSSDYSASDIVTITLAIRFDNALHFDSGDANITLPGIIDRTVGPI